MMTIKNKLLLIPFVTALLVGTVSLASIYLINQDVQEIIERERPKLEAALEMEINLKEASGEVFRILQDGNPTNANKESYYEAIAEYRQYRDQYIVRMRTEQEEKIFKSLDKAFFTFERLGEALFVLQEEQPLKPVPASENKKQVLMKQYMDTIKELDFLLDEKIQQIDMELMLQDEAQVSNITQYVFIGVLASTILTLIIGLLLSRQILRPIKELTEASHSFASGNLQHRVKPKYDQEFNALIHSLNTMAHDLDSSQKELRKLNTFLENRISEESRKNREKDHLLIQQSKMAAMGEMIGVIAHQWKQPLSISFLLIDTLIDLDEYGELDSQKLADSATKIKEQFYFMEQTINDFRNFYKPDKQLKAFQPCESLLKVKEMFKGSFEKQNITITIHDHEHFFSMGYPNEFMQVALNIFNNAKDIIQEKKIRQGRIDCHISHDDGKGIIRIQDNGGGIPEELLPDKIFEAYVSTKEEKGTGIGLQISKTIIEQNLNGKLWAHNIEGGAEFVIELPLANKQPF